MQNNNKRRASQLATKPTYPTSPSSSATSFSPFALLPLRFFLGFTFLYAGIQKLTDPTFFAATGNGSITRQLAGYVDGSPLSGFITNVAIPHATLFGGIVAWGEVAIGLGTIAGILYRPAAFFGILLSLVLWLTATWQINPYFYGADIFALVGWITLTLAGTNGLFTLEPALAARVWPISSSIFGVAGTRQLYRLLGWQMPATELVRGKQIVTSSTIDRRQMLQGFAAGVASLVAGAGIWNLLRSSGTTGAAVEPTATTAASGGTQATATVGSGSGTVIGNLQTLATNSAVNFTPPNTSDLGILVRLPSGKVAAYNTTCTHAGCEVHYSKSSQLFVCPCHGAEFDPAQDAKVIQGPARTPLQEYVLSVDNSTGAITFNS